MSRIGKLPVAVPSGVDVAIDGPTVTVKGPKGTLPTASRPRSPSSRMRASWTSGAPTTSASASRCTG